MSHSCVNKSKDDSYIKARCCQVSLVQTARWKGIFDSEDRVRKSEGRYFHQRFTRSDICKDKEVSMQLVSLRIRGSVAINYIFGLIWRCYGPKQDILDYFGTNIFFNYPIIYYRKIKVYRVGKMDMGRSHWKNGVSGANFISISTMLLIVRDKTLW